ncbi:MAG TPA: ion transporter [Chloroflexota bacterium]|nr:ion transporter [Chloroflexota bacterium]
MDKGATGGEVREALERERRELLGQVEEWLETPMLVLGFVWLALLVAELVWGISPMLEMAGTAIWIVFIAELVLRLTLSPERGTFLKRNWLTVLSLLVPALRLVRLARLAKVLRAARTARGLRLFRVVSSLNRGMRALGATMERRGFGYAVGMTGLVLFGGAAGMHAFEKDAGGLTTYGEALWWTTMLLTTLGSEYWPRSAEGRLLCVLLAVYAFGVFGYITATLATYFVGQDAGNREAELAGQSDLRALKEEVASLRAALLAGRD